MADAISKIDHIAITAADLPTAEAFYCRVLGAKVVHDFVVDGKLVAKQFRIGGAMVNIHKAGHGHSLVAARPTPGAVDLCFRWDAPIAEAVVLLQRAEIAIEEGPVERYASDGKAGQSVYFRDPDGNLLELLTTVG
jgi:catechol 2,3-dioxygenase-like lactoylglutathione lyase family enzyme